MEITAIITLHAGGKVIPPGSRTTINPDEAKRLVKLGFASYVEVIEAAADTTKPSTPSLEDIADVIELLDIDKDFGKTGKPHVEAIEDILGSRISAEQRDKAWQMFLKDQNAV